jgi:hypothetical protein
VCTIDISRKELSIDVLNDAGGNSFSQGLRHIRTHNAHASARLQKLQRLALSNLAAADNDATRSCRSIQESIASLRSARLLDRVARLEPLS